MGQLISKGDNKIPSDVELFITTYHEKENRAGLHVLSYSGEAKLEEKTFELGRIVGALHGEKITKFAIRGPVNRIDQDALVFAIGKFRKHDALSNTIHVEYDGSNDLEDWYPNQELVRKTVERLSNNNPQKFIFSVV